MDLIILALAIIGIAMFCGVLLATQRTLMRYFAKWEAHKDAMHRAALEQFGQEYDHQTGEHYRRELIVHIVDQMRKETGPHVLYFSRGGTRYRVLPGNIYLLSVNKEYYKIGYAKDVVRRITDMQVSCPYTIELEHIIVTEHTVRLERLLHRRYQSRHVQGEWFRLTPDDVAAICDIASPVTIQDLDRLGVDNAARLHGPSDNNIHRAG